MRCVYKQVVSKSSVVDHSQSTGNVFKFSAVKILCYRKSFELYFWEGSSVPIDCQFVVNNNCLFICSAWIPPSFKRLEPSFYYFFYFLTFIILYKNYPIILYPIILSYISANYFIIFFFLFSFCNLLLLTILPFIFLYYFVFLGLALFLWLTFCLGIFTETPLSHSLTPFAVF